MKKQNYGMGHKKRIDKQSKLSPKWRILLPRLGVSALFFTFLIRWIDLKLLWEAARGIRAEYFFVSYAILVFGDLLIAVRLFKLLQSSIIELPIRRLYQIGFIAKFYAMFLPAGVGQAIARWYKVTENKYGRMQFVFVSIFEKALFFFVTLLCVGLPLLFSTDPRIEHIRIRFVPIFIILSSLLTSFFLLLVVKPLYSYFEKWTWNMRVFFINRIPKMESLFTASKMYCGRMDILSYACFFSAAIQATILLRIAFLFVAVSVDLPWYTILWMSSFVFFVQIMPVSFAGIGVRETVFAYIFHLYNLDQESGALVGLLFFAQMLISATIGGVLEIRDRGNERIVVKSPHISKSNERP